MAELSSTAPFSPINLVRMRGYGVFVLVVVCCVVGTLATECICDPFGECLTPCPAGTHSYTPGCGRGTLSRRTCRAPVARVIGRYCDYSRCDCRDPQVWDEAESKCVLLDDCSDQSQFNKKEGDEK